MDPNQAFMIEMVKAISPGVGTVVMGLFVAWIASRGTRRAEKAAVAAAAITADLSVKTDEMKGQLDGKLEKMMTMMEESGILKGRALERQEQDAARVTAAATERANAREDRAEGAAASMPAPTSELPVIPVETRTEAAEKKE